MIQRERPVGHVSPKRRESLGVRTMLNPRLGGQDTRLLENFKEDFGVYVVPKNRQ